MKMFKVVFEENVYVEAGEDVHPESFFTEDVGYNGDDFHKLINLEVGQEYVPEYGQTITRLS